MPRATFVMPRLALLAVLMVIGASASGCMAFTTSDSPFHQGIRNQGSWRADGFGNGPGNDNYFTGWLVTSDPTEDVVVRNYFTFDLTDACAARAVTLRISRFDQTAPISYELHDVSTPAQALNAETGRDVSIYEDLGSGTSFGRFDIPEGDPSGVLTLPLNAAGVAAYNAARDGFFSIGGSAPQADPGEYVFGASGFSQGTQHLIAICTGRTSP